MCRSEILSWVDTCEKITKERMEDTKVAGADAGTSGDRSDAGDQEEIPELLVMKLMQLMCEGHFKPNQQVFKDQPFNHKSYDLLGSMVKICGACSTVNSRSSTVVISTTCELILEVLQGPCVQNQEYFAMESDLLEILNTLLCAEANPESDQDAVEEAQCKTTILKICKALTECQKKPSIIFERLMSAVHAESLTRHLRLPPPPVPLETITDETDRGEALLAQLKLQYKPLTPMQVECLVLVQMVTWCVLQLLEVPSDSTSFVATDVRLQSTFPRRG
jgi:hypothetical protein